MIPENYYNELKARLDVINKHLATWSQLSIVELTDCTYLVSGLEWEHYDWITDEINDWIADWTLGVEAIDKEIDTDEPILTIDEFVSWVEYWILHHNK